MGLFRRKKRIKAEEARKQLFNSLLEDNKRKDARIRELEDLCKEKDKYFEEMISDGLRHGSSLAGKHMSDKKKYKHGKH